MPDSTNAVFLSYASQDAEAARHICEALRAAGIEVWFDQSELRGGDSWDRQIRKKIHDCALFIPVISAHSQERLEGYFRREWKLAVDRTHDMADEKAFLVPVVVDATTERDARVPDKFREIQWSRLPSGDVPPAFVERVSRLLAYRPQNYSDPTSLAPVAAVKTDNSRWLRPTLAIVGVAFVLAMAYVAVSRFERSPHGEQGAKNDAPTARVPNPTPEKSIAVLPFVDLSEKRDQEYFSDGLTEALIDLLVQTPGLHVPARTSSYYFKGKSAPVEEIAKSLHVAHLLEGSVQRSGNVIRVTAQLIRAQDGYHLWSQSFDHKIEDIFNMQDDIANSVAQVLKVKLQGGADKQASAPVDLDAYTLYLEARSEYRKSGSRAITEDAIAKYQRALEIAPEYAPALIALASANIWAADNYWLNPGSTIKEAKQMAEQAVRLAPESVDAHILLATILREYAHDIPAADAELATAVTLNPNDPGVLRNLAGSAERRGNYAKAIELYQRALESDPLSISLLERLGDMQDRSGDIAAAERTYRQVLGLDPSLPFAHAFLSFVLTEEGQANEALQELQTESAPMGRLAGLAMAYHAMDRRSDAESAASEWEHRYGTDHATGAAMLREALGDTDAALHWIEVAISKHEDLTNIEFDQAFAGLRADPRYGRLMAARNAQSR